MGSEKGTLSADLAPFTTSKAQPARADVDKTHRTPTPASQAQAALRQGLRAASCPAPGKSWEGWGLRVETWAAPTERLGPAQGHWPQMAKGSRKHQPAKKTSERPSGAVGSDRKTAASSRSECANAPEKGSHWATRKGDTVQGA